MGERICQRCRRIARSRIGDRKIIFSRKEIFKFEDLSDDASRYGTAGSPTSVVKIFTPEQRTEGMILKGECADMAKQLAEALKKDLKI